MRILKDAIESFYSPALYHEVATVRRGIGMRYIVLMTVIMALAYSVYFLKAYGILQLAIEEVPSFAATLPQVVIKDGKLSIDRPDGRFNLPVGPAGDKRVWISVDTHYHVADIPALKKFMEANRMVALFTADYVVNFKNGALEVRSFADSGHDFTITHEQWMKLANQISQWGMKLIICVTALSLLVGLFLMYSISALLGAIILKILSLILRAGVNFGAAMRIAALINIPYQMFTCFPVILGGSNLGNGLSWLIYIMYIVFALFAVKRRRVA